MKDMFHERPNRSSILRALVIVAVVALGTAAACSQSEGPPASVVPEPAASTAGDTIPDQATAQNGSRRFSPLGRGFVPLDDPAFLAVDEAGFIDDEELVMGVEWAGEVRAYPVRMLRYHHVINDTVRGEPLLVTY